jgi:starch phosphorylase
MPQDPPSDQRAPQPPAPGASRVAYFTMEVALRDELPTYSGGLGVLAGDFLRSAADLALPLVAVTLCYRRGYFHQRLDADGGQHEQPVEWSPERHLERCAARVTIPVSGRPVTVAAWRLVLRGVGGAAVPIYFLDTDLAENDPADRSITDQLYGGDDEHRLRQEAVLGLGGVAYLRALGHGDLDTFHMNEGHAALLTLALCDEAGGPFAATAAARGACRARCAFTTHTPVPAGHDRFTRPVVEAVLGAARVAQLDGLAQLEGGELNMSELAISCSRYVNGVSRRHAAVSREMFPGVEVSAITNGVHVATWAAPSTARLFDEFLPGWRQDSALLRYANDIPLARLETAHAEAKRTLFAEVLRRTGADLDPKALTIGLARRATRYKQIGLLFSDLARLRALSEDAGPIQVLCAGKAHPRDEGGKALLRGLVEAGRALGDDVPVVLLENYDLELAGKLCAGTDVWLNTPQPPNEASGTSGMKAAVNGVPSLSILDGWWIEGWLEGITGWAIGSADEPPEDPATAADALYRALGERVLPLYFGDPDGYRAVMRAAIALNGSFFATDRMAREYALNAYGLAGTRRS